MFEASSEKALASIADEQKSIAGIEAGIPAIQHQREEALVEGDHKAVNVADAKLAQIRQDVDRRNERIGLLHKKATEAVERETAKALDAVATGANGLREAGEKLIRTEYAKHAAALASTLGRIAAIEQGIAEANVRLSRAGRPLVPSPNQVRCLPSAVLERIERRRVGIGNPEHPFHGRASIGQIDTSKAIVHGTGDSVDVWMEVDVVTKERRPAFVPESLTTSVVLPSIEPDATAANFWDRDAARRHSAAALASLGL
ncbi:MAG: hypothetical protein ABIQ70_07060 [Dokdonella sp.]